MVDLLRNGLAWLEDQRRAHMTSAVTIRRAAASTTGVLATKGRTEVEVDNGDVTLESDVIDWLISTADYDFGSGPADPKTGDEIDEVLHGKTYTWEVMPLAGEAEWRYSDVNHQTLRIHTRLTKVT